MSTDDKTNLAPGDPLFKTRAFQLDLGRQPENLTTLCRLLTAAARFGFNQCHLYFENSLQLQAFGPAARGLSKAEVTQLVAHATALGIEVVPSFNFLGHNENFLVHDCFKPLDEAREGWRQPWQWSHTCLCPALAATKEWIRAIVAEAVLLFPSRNFHVGLDETWVLGSCSLCRRRAAEIGLGGLFAEYAIFLNDLVKEHGRRMWMWADMCFYYGDVLEHLPRDIVMVDWYYERVAEAPQFSFRNWQTINSTQELAAAGFTVVPAGIGNIDNVRTFTRYAQGLEIDTFLVTDWEGTLRFPDETLLMFCKLGHFLKSGALPVWQQCGSQLFPEATEAERRDLLLAWSHGGTDPQMALELVAGKDKLMSAVIANMVLRTFMQCEVGEIARECDFTARQVLRRHSEATTAFAPLWARVAQARRLGDIWLQTLGELRARFAEEESERGIYDMARRVIARLQKLATQIESFCAAPSAETFPGHPVALVLELVAIDHCAHACRIDVGEALDNLRTLYEVSALPVAIGDTVRNVTIPLAQPPRFVRLSINGYARLGVASVRCRTVAADLLPKDIVATGGTVSDAPYLLEWNRKAAFFNEPDVAATWLKNDIQSDNFVTLEF